MSDDPAECSVSDNVEVLSEGSGCKEATEQEVYEYAEFLGIDPETEPQLMWIAREGVVAPVPAPWKACQEDDEVFYFNYETKQSIWDHPCDEYYRGMVDKFRANPDAERDPPPSQLQKGGKEGAKDKTEGQADEEAGQRDKPTAPAAKKVGLSGSSSTSKDTEKPLVEADKSLGDSKSYEDSSFVSEAVDSDSDSWHDDETPVAGDAGPKKKLFGRDAEGEDDSKEEARAEGESEDEEDATFMSDAIDSSLSLSPPGSSKPTSPQAPVAKAASSRPAPVDEKAEAKSEKEGSDEDDWDTKSQERQDAKDEDWDASSASSAEAEKARAKSKGSAAEPSDDEDADDASFVSEAVDSEPEEPEPSPAPAKEESAEGTSSGAAALAKESAKGEGVVVGEKEKEAEIGAVQMTQTASLTRSDVQRFVGVGGTNGFYSARSIHSSNPSEVSEEFKSDFGLGSPLMSARSGTGEREGHSLELSITMDTEGGRSMSVGGGAASEPSPLSPNGHEEAVGGAGLRKAGPTSPSHIPTVAEEDPASITSSDEEPPQTRGKGVASAAEKPTFAPPTRGTPQTAEASATVSWEDVRHHVQVLADLLRGKEMQAVREWQEARLQRLTKAGA
eukprot:TRINITY_DN31573_c0_g1_i1.p1 TRINITY_DN31573_c0_g1~~TRINITY_DN31573_c0_g1_i1.p1  ORF type:complete len:617 (-),score=173.86 TRINITY_DN31573_c0_g1_i1:126-1976(-)